MSLSSRPSRQRGFTIVELAIVTVIIGILAALALPAIRLLVARVQAGATVNDLRVFREAFRLYSVEHDAWPPAGGGSIPDGMEGYLRETSWTRRTPIGGAYRWDGGGAAGGKPARAAIRIVANGDDAIIADYTQLLRIDRELDDGNLFTGSLQAEGYPQLVFILD